MENITKHDIIDIKSCPFCGATLVKITIGWQHPKKGVLPNSAKCLASGTTVLTSQLENWNTRIGDIHYILEDEEPVFNSGAKGAIVTSGELNAWFAYLIKKEERK